MALMKRGTIETWLLVCLLVWPFGGCSPSPEQLEVAEALDRTITSLEGGDMQALWDITAPAAQKEVLKLHAELHAALLLVDQLYPSDMRDAARKSLGHDIIAAIPLNDPAAGPKLLRRILNPNAVRLDEKARDGLRTRGAVIDGDKAVIHTSADEKFTFEKTTDGWRSGLVMDLIDQNRRFDVLRENARKIGEAQQSRRDAWVASKDPKAPQGAYNLIRKTVGTDPVKPAALFSLLDANSRGVALEALQTARTLQKTLQRRSKKAQRRGLYKKYGIDQLVKVTTDRDLFALWVKGSKYVPPIKDVRDPPERLEGDISTGTVAVITSKGARLSMQRGKDGVWRLASYAQALRDGLVKPLKDHMASLNKPAKSKPGG